MCPWPEEPDIRPRAETEIPWDVEPPAWETRPSEIKPCETEPSTYDDAFSNTPPETGYEILPPDSTDPSEGSVTLTDFAKIDITKPSWSCMTDPGTEPEAMFEPCTIPYKVKPKSIMRQLLWRYLWRHHRNWETLIAYLVVKINFSPKRSVFPLHALLPFKSHRLLVFHNFVRNYEYEF